MTTKEYIILYIIIASLTLLTIETVKILSLPTTKNIEMIITDLSK